MPRESAIVASILRKLRAAGAFAEKVHGNQYVRAGMPDIIVCYKGLYIAVEVKQPGKKPTAVQERVLWEIEQAGGIVAWMNNAAQVDSLLRYIDDESPLTSGRYLRPAGRPADHGAMQVVVPEAREGAR